VLITDRPIDPAAWVAPDDPGGLQVVRVGTPVENSAILSAMFAPEPDNPLLGRFVVRVGHWGARAGEVRIEISRAGGAPLLNETGTIEPGTTRDYVVPGLPADGDRLVVRIRTGDSVPADDQATIRLPLRGPILVSANESVPPAVRLALQADPLVQIVDAGQEADVDVRLGAGQCSAARPAIIIDGSDSPDTTGRLVRVLGDSALTRGLDFEGATSGSGGGVSLPESAEALLGSGDAVLAALSTANEKPCLHLSRALFADDAQTAQRAAFAVLVSRSLRRLAGWDDDPVILTPERAAADPVWARRTGHNGAIMAMPGSRQAGDLSLPAPDDTKATTTEPPRWAVPAWFEVILSLAIICFLLEAVLHTRGRIP